MAIESSAIRQEAPLYYHKNIEAIKLLGNGGLESRFKLDDVRV